MTTTDNDSDDDKCVSIVLKSVVHYVREGTVIVSRLDSQQLVSPLAMTAPFLTCSCRNERDLFTELQRNKIEPLFQFCKTTPTVDFSPGVHQYRNVPLPFSHQLSVTMEFFPKLGH